MKRIITSLLTLALILGAMLIPSTAAPAWNGDANGDGQITVNDAVAILRHLAAWQIDLDPLADFDENDKVNTRDAILVLQYLAGYNVAPDSLLEAQYGVSEVDFEIPEPTPTETVSGSQFGFDPEAEDNSQAFYDAVAYLKEHPGTTLEIEKGVYKMAPASAVTLSGVENCVIDGGGSTFLYTKGRYFTTTDGSNLVMFRNMTIDWDWENSYKLTSMVRVRAVHDTDDAAYKRVEYEFFTMDDASYALTEPWENMLPCDPERLTIGVLGVSDQMNPSRWNTALELTEANVITATVPNGNVLKVGSVWMLRHYNYGGSVFYTTGGATNVTYKDVTIYSAQGIGFIMEGGTTNHVRLSGVTIGLNPENSDKYRISTTADAIHIKDTGGYFIVENCDIGYQGDDGLNIHDNVGVIEDIFDNVITVKALNTRNFNVGSRIRFKSGTDFSDFEYTATIVDKKSTGNGQYTLILDSEPPLEIDVGAVVIDMSNDSSNYIIRNNYFHENRGRGLLLNSSNGLVENNRFYRTQAQAINITVEHWAHSWLEGSGIDNLIIRNNIFEEGNVEGREACITFIANTTYVQGGTINGECFRNILISGNTFINTNKQAIIARSATNMSIIGNTIKNPNPIESTYTEVKLNDRGEIQLYGPAFVNATVAHNTWEASPYLPENVNEVLAAATVKNKHLTEFGNNIAEAKE